MSDEHKDEFQEAIQQHVNALAKGFDSVFIVATKYDKSDGRTARRVAMSGNYYAVLGSIAEFLEYERLRNQAESLGVDNDGEEWKQQ